MTVSVETYIAFGIALYFVHVTTSVLGVYALEFLSFASGNIHFQLKRDIIRMGVCSLISLLPPLYIFYIFPTFRLVIIYALLFFFSVMIAYLGISIREVLVIAVANVIGIFAFQVLMMIGGLWFVYLLVAALLVFLLINASKQKQVKKEQARASMRNEGKVRDMAARDPMFRTFCFECKHFNHDKEYCQLKIDNQPVKEIQVKGNTLCASWEKAETR
jgi:hypothetical protein